MRLPIAGLTCLLVMSSACQPSVVSVTGSMAAMAPVMTDGMISGRITAPGFQTQRLSTGTPLQGDDSGPLIGDDPNTPATVRALRQNLHRYLPASRGGQRPLDDLAEIDPQGRLGIPQATRAPLNMTIDGIGMFMVATETGDTLYTRRGAFTADSDGQVIWADGKRLSPLITIPENSQEVRVTADGAIEFRLPDMTDWQVAGQIALASFVNPAGLQDLGDGLYAMTAHSGAPLTHQPGQNGMGMIVGGTLEIDPCTAGWPDIQTDAVVSLKDGATILGVGYTNANGEFTIVRPRGSAPLPEGRRLDLEAFKRVVTGCDSVVLSMRTVIIKQDGAFRSITGSAIEMNPLTGAMAMFSNHVDADSLMGRLQPGAQIPSADLQIGARDAGTLLAAAECVRFLMAMGMDAMGPTGSTLVQDALDKMARDGVTAVLTAYLQGDDVDLATHFENTPDPNGMLR